MYDKINQRIDELKNNLIKSTQELIRIKSVKAEEEEGMPFGSGINEALDSTLQIAQSMGLKNKNIDAYAGYIEIGDGEELLGVLCHLDVVPEGSNWTYPPYGAEIVDNKIYGRGSIDNKGPAMASLYALKAIADSDIKLKKRVRLILGTDEESNWQGIDYYLKNEETPDIAFSPDAEFPVIHGEKGILNFKLSKVLSNVDKNDSLDKSKKTKRIKSIIIEGGNAPNMVPDFCKAIIESNYYDYINEKAYQYNMNNMSANLELNQEEEKIVINSHGVSSHGSLPQEGVNAISHLMLFLQNLDLLSGEIDSFLNFYIENFGLEFNGQSLGYEGQGNPSHLLTLNIGQIKINSEKAEIVIDIRYPLSWEKEKVVGDIKKLIKTYDIKYQELNHKPSLYVEKVDPLVEKLMKVYQDYTGDKSEAVIIGGGTYARAIEKAVAFGPTFPGQEELAHQKDEYISVDDLILITKIYAAAIIELAGE
ncbi:dipeptidase PepV [Natronospora cellulosivora (SeqCode)]